MRRPLASVAIRVHFSSASKHHVQYVLIKNFWKLNYVYFAHVSKVIQESSCRCFCCRRRRRERRRGRLSSLFFGEMYAGCNWKQNSVFAVLSSGKSELMGQTFREEHYELGLIAKRTSLCRPGVCNRHFTIDETVTYHRDYIQGRRRNGESCGMLIPHPSDHCNWTKEKKKKQRASRDI